MRLAKSSRQSFFICIVAASISATLPLRTTVWADTIAGPEAAAQVQRGETGTLVARAPIFLLPDSKRPPLTVLEAGTRVRIIETTDEWYKVEFRDSALGDRVGYVQRSDVQVSAPPSPRSTPPASQPSQQERPSAPPTLDRQRPAATRRPARGLRSFLNVNGIYQSTDNSFSNASSFPLNVETAEVTTVYRVAKATAFDLSAGGGLWRNVGLGVGLSWFSKKGNAEMTERLPHPFYFGQPRTVAGTVSDLNRRDIALHISALVAAPLSRRLQIVGFGGPTVFFVTQKLASTVHYTDSYPYDSATFAQPDLLEESKTKLGFNVGADLTVMLSTNVGVGAIVRFTRASVPLTASDSQFTVKAGGVQTGAGVRFRF